MPLKGGIRKPVSYINLAIQCALFTTERRGCDFRKLALSTGQRKLQAGSFTQPHLDVKFITQRVYCFITHLLNNPYLLFQASSSHKSVTVRNQTRVYTHVLSFFFFYVIHIARFLTVHMLLLSNGRA
jgi:hypothetical protein